MVGIMGLHYKGNSLFCLKRYEEAVKCYELLLSLEPENSSAKDALELAKTNLSNTSSTENSNLKLNENIMVFINNRNYDLKIYQGNNGIFYAPLSSLLNALEAEKKFLRNPVMTR